MANSEAERRGSRGQLTWVWAAGAVVLVAAFLFWLGASSEPSNLVAIQEARDAADLPAVPGDQPVPVTLDDFGANVDGYRGQNVRLEGVSVLSRMGPQAFWIALAGDIPFLVRITPALIAGGQDVQAGQRLNVVGIVHERTDSVLTVWEQEGVVTTDGQRAEAEYASAYIDATSITVVQ